MRMPGISGIEACRQISTLAPNTKVIILTSYAEDELFFPPSKLERWVTCSSASEIKNWCVP
ncbi:MAG UNVERIFIED_CONTAM: hypothetical protein LVT10_24520 [Anaerolineae bacterium]